MNDNRHMCSICGAPIEPDIAGLNYKYLGGTIKQIRCLECLAEFLEVDKNALFKQIEYFRSMGCIYFKCCSDINEKVCKIASDCGFSMMRWKD